MVNYCSSSGSNPNLAPNEADLYAKPDKDRNVSRKYFHNRFWVYHCLTTYFWLEAPKQAEGPGLKRTGHIFALDSAAVKAGDDLHEVAKPLFLENVEWYAKS